MIHPREIAQCPPPIYAQGDLLKLHRVYGRCDGIITPRVYLDRKAETLPGFNALVYHEAVHAVEVHAFVGLMLLIVAVTTLAVGITNGLWWSWLTFGLTSAGWLLWRREQEVRADACALFGTDEAEFYAFATMHEHPSGLWGRWQYATTPQARLERARRRARRYE